MRAGGQVVYVHRPNLNLRIGYDSISYVTLTQDGPSLPG
jgi:hypothetical protein